MFTSSVTRITGMASGLDTDSIVQKLMSAESITLNRLKQQQQKQIWVSDAYRQWNKDFFAFQQNTLFNMKLSSSYNTFDVSSSLAGSVTGTGTSDAIPGTYSVAVNKIAESATLTGNVQLGSNNSLGLTTDTTISLSVVNDLNNPTNIQTADLLISKDATINDVVSQINGAKDSNGKSIGLQAIYDANLKQIIVKTKNTGADTEITFSSTSTEGQTLLSTTLGFGTTLTDNGENAEIIFNGTMINTLTSNNVTVMGISLSLKSPTGVDGSGNPITSSMTVSRNIETEINNIKTFVEKYNDLLGKLNKVYDEPVYRDYLPLLDEQRDEMFEKQIEMWEEKAKSGLLRRDSIMSEVIDKMRSAMSAYVNNGSDYNSLASIGISSKSWQDKGKLYIDEVKLRAALQADPDAVTNLFSQKGDTAQGTNGLIHQLSDIMTDSMKDLSKKAGSSGSSYYDQSVIGKLLTNIQSNITRQTDILTNKENQYYKQFAAMEAAIAKFNSQSSWLYQQMGG